MPNRFLSRPGLFLLCLALRAGVAAQPAGAAEGTFEPLPVQHPVTTMALTEDGKTVLVAHEAQNRISVWDVEAGRVVRVVDCPAPRHVICRGDKAYVANWGKRTISVLDATKEFAVTDKIGPLNSEVYYLSAPGGDAFAGKLLTTCRDGENNRQRFMVDTKEKSTTLVMGGSIAPFMTFSLDGRHLLEQSDFSRWGGMGALQSFPAAEYLADRRTRGTHSKGTNSTRPMVYQVRRGDYWFSERGLHEGMPPAVVSLPEVHTKELVFPDARQPLFYLLSGAEMHIYSLDRKPPLHLTAVPVTSVPEQLVKYRPASEVMVFDKRQVFYHPFAVSHGGSAHLFACEPKEGRAFRCVIKLPDLAVAARESLAAEAAVVKFVPLPGAEAVQSAAMTEDGKFVLLAHRKEGQVSVWDVAAERNVKTVPCASPAHILCRGGKAYVANYGKGTITVLDPAKDWQPANELRVGTANVYYLTAPGGPFFKDSILAVCLGESNESLLQFVDVAKDTSRQIPPAGPLAPYLVTFSYDGKTLIEQTGSSGCTHVFDATAYLARSGRQRLPENVGSDANLLTQVREGTFWFSGNQILLGSPLRPFVSSQVSAVFPDMTRPVVYFLRDHTITAHQMTPEMPVLGTHEAEEKSLWGVSGSASAGQARRGPFCPLAATHGDKTHLFVYKESMRKLYRAVMPVNQPVTAATAGTPDTPGVHYVLSTDCDLWSCPEGEVILLAGAGLRVLDRDGQRVVRQAKLPAEYTRVVANKSCFLCLRQDELLVLDRATLQIKRQIKFGAGKAEGLAPHPRNPAAAFVSVYDDEGGKLDPIEAHKVLVVGLETGKATALPKVVGATLAVHPEGKYLYTAFDEKYQDGYQLTMFQTSTRTYDLHVNKSYDRISAVVSYDIQGEALNLRHYSIGQGGMGLALRVSPDGAFVSFRGGDQNTMRDRSTGDMMLPLFDSGDLRPLGVKARCVMPKGARDVSFHPAIEWVASCNLEEIRIFRRSTGALLPDKLAFEGGRPKDLEHVLFTPGGRHLLADGKDGMGRRMVRSLRLNLTEEEKAAVERAAPR